MKPVVSVKELMRDMIDPAADYIFDAVKVETTRSGTVESTPKTDQDWEKIRIGAVTLAEGIYLLKLTRPFTPPGEENRARGRRTQLSGAQIKAKLEADPVLWNAKIEALRNIGLEVLEIVKKRTPQSYGRPATTSIRRAKCVTSSIGIQVTSLSSRRSIEVYDS